MSRYWLALTGIFFLFAACSSTSEPTDSASLAQSTASPELTWLETETAGVALGLWKPSGWAADTRGGLVLVEEAAAVGDEPNPVMRGAVVNFFCPDLDIFHRSDDSPNLAMEIMEQAIALPYVRSVAVAISDPVPFDWNGHDAAYYLLTGHGDMRSLVLGIYLPESDRLLAMNVSMPALESARVRDLLPSLFAGFTVDGVELGGDALDGLPLPLVFPTGSDDPA